MSRLKLFAYLVFAFSLITVLMSVCVFNTGSKIRETSQTALFANRDPQTRAQYDSYVKEQMRYSLGFQVAGFTTILMSGYWLWAVFESKSTSDNSGKD